MSNSSESGLPSGVAIIGMAGRFPKANNVRKYWENIRDGIDCIERFEVEDLEVADAAELSARSDYVKARSILEDVELFDASFFGMLPKEAELIDPQHRVFLECCWEAFEDAGYDPLTFPGEVSVYAGCSANTYFLNNLCVDRKYLESYTRSYQVGNYTTLLGTNADFLATRVSYKLNLKGPSFTIQSGCSTSLVAICQACQGLLTFQSDMALAGGVSITVPQRRGYLYDEGGMVSPDGSCRTFDANAQGTVFGSGSGVILLKRLEDALADGDNIHGVIRGFALNNDGSLKAGYTAPSVEGQAKVIAMAHAFAGVHAESIGYVEVHGTATPLGDPIEFAALTRAFRAQTDAKGFCAVGCVKPNVGHLDIASGVVGLINAVQVLTHKQIPPLRNFRSQNPRIDLESSPFYVNQTLSQWERGPQPRRAGVSAFGVGGTNAHVILEEAPAVIKVPTTPGPELLLLSAKSSDALEVATANLVEHFEAHPDLELESAAHTLQLGRRGFEHRRFLVTDILSDAIDALKAKSSDRVATHRHDGLVPPLVFMFPGQGSQHPNMGSELYRKYTNFRQDVDLCSEILLSHLGFDIREAIYPTDSASGLSGRSLTDTSIAQPSLFVIEYALARLWMSWGVKPSAMIGHSVGEIVAACLSGVLSLKDSLDFVATRGRLMQQLPPGAMLSVRLGESDVIPMLNGDVSLAAVNSPRQCVLSGPETAIESLRRDLEARGVATRRLRTSHAFHSSMMDPLIGLLEESLEHLRFHKPTIPYISTVSGTWIRADEATSLSYWSRHFREPVRFAAGLSELFNESSRVFLEIGPGNTLSALCRQQAERPSGQLALASLAEVDSGNSGVRTILSTAGHLWSRGVPLDWSVMAGPGRRRCSLPTYPFERTRHWVDPPGKTTGPTNCLSNGSENGDKEHRLMSESTPKEVSVDRSNSASKQALLKSLANLFEEHSGLELSGFDSRTTFLEMGFDSLILTQVAQSLYEEFGLKITFRQLLDRESTLDALAAYLEKNLPSSVLSPESKSTTSDRLPTLTPERPEKALVGRADFEPEVASSEAMTSPGATSSALESIMKEQLRTMSGLMAMQLDALRASNVPQPAGKSSEPAQSSQAIQEPSITTKAKPPTPTQTPVPYSPYKPIQPGQVGTLTERQDRYLGELISRTIRRTRRSKEHVQSHRAILADPRVVSGFRSQWKEMVYPIVTVRSRGSRIWDLDGNEYIDILNGYGPIMLGHAPDIVTEAVAEQLELGFETGPQTLLAGKVAQQVCELTNMERVTFCNTGSEAVMAALRVARTVTGRKRIVLFAGSYHGAFDEVLVKGVRKGGVLQSLPSAPGILREMAANATVLDYATPEALEYIRANASDLAAVLVEPVQSRHPDLQPIEFLKEVRRITADAGAALIFDEVVTGFRVHPGGVQALFGIKADLATYGKVLGGGLPVGILTGTAPYMDALDGGMWNFGDDSFPEAGVTFFAGTFVRHPLALASASAVLTHLKEQGPNLQIALSEKTTRLVQAINARFELHGVPTRIEHFGSIFYFSMPGDLPLGSLFYYQLREKGIYLQEGFPCFLTTAHSEEDLTTIINAFDQTIVEMQAGEAIPSSSTPKQATLSASSATDAIESAPLTEPQVEIWLSARLGDQESCAFNESFTIHFDGPLNRLALESAVQHLVDRHGALRAKFESDGKRQVFPPNIRMVFPVVDLSGLSAGDRVTRLEEMIRTDASTPFDLLNGPLVRTQLVVLGPELHALIFTSHHIVCDGWSTNIILDELSSLYSAVCLGSEAALPPASQFIDYARSESERKGGSEWKATEAWWIEQFSPPPPALELPTDRARPREKSCRGATSRAFIDAEQYKQIKQFGARRGCTLFATLLSAFEILLQRLSSQTDIIVGIPAAGQSLVNGENLVGHCVNFLPLRVPFEDDPAVTDLLTRVRDTLLDAYDHQRYTYGSLVRKLALRRDPSRLPLVEVQFNLERLGTDLSFEGLKVTVDANEKSFVNFDLFLNVVESDQGLVLDCDYNCDLFDQETLDRWLHHYKVLLKEMVKEPGRTVSKIPLLQGEERRSLLADWNQTYRNYPLEKCVHTLFEEQAARTPDSTAVVFESQEVTYSELNQSSNRLAHYLKSLGVGPNTTVAICLHRSLDMLIGLLAVLKAGAAYIPLDPNYPKERITAVIKDSNPSLILTQAQVIRELGSTSCQVVGLEDAVETALQLSTSNPDVQVTSRSLAYIIFTSGSTGRPKGVEISHRAVVNFLLSMSEQPGLSAADTLLAVTTPSFDIAVLELYLPLIVGARVVIAGPEDVVDGNRLVTLLEKNSATVLQATPATWRLLIEAGWRGSTHFKVLCGGEALPRDLADSLLARAGEVWNMYGPTETTVWSSVLRVQSGTGPVPIGPPIANTQFYILDGSGEPVPLGVAGELHIGGEGIARGYWNQPALTSDKFVKDHFSENPAGRLYKTGDVVRYLSTGKLEFLGRLDSQVKVRGFRIETSEVETALMRYPGIRECVVVAREDSPGDKRLVAYFVFEGMAPAHGDLRRFIAVSLPDYMVPTNFVQLPALPRTPNGKIDRRRLPSATPAIEKEAQDYVPPKNSVERVIAEICRSVLNVSRVSVETSLFDLGADSVHLFQIVARANEAGITISPRQILSGRTISVIVAEYEKSEQERRDFEKPRLMALSRDQYKTHRSRLREVEGSDATGLN